VQQGLDRRLVAVMFADMVGYTALIQADERGALHRRDAFVAAVERHHEAFGGTIVQRLGDGTMSMFPSALAAVQSAVEIQRDLGRAAIPVRIGIHVGEVIIEAERLSGDAVNLASRIESFAVPGSVIVSEGTREQLKNRDDVALIGVGRFRLKNVGQPLELYAVAADGLVVPDSVALEGKGDRLLSLPGQLPEPASALLGRSRELASLVELVRAHRIVTITGPGGVGKTRVLVELGRTLVSEFADGAAFISLADVMVPDGLAPALAAALDVKEAEERSLVEGVIALIGDRSALLLLDNLEQIAAAAPDIARIVAECPNLRTVVTSRTPLRLPHEHEYLLSPLELPTDGAADSTAALGDYAAIALFVERARAVKAGFGLTPENGPVVAAVCRRLDGLPLALELAAARLRIMSPESLLERLDHTLKLLTSSSRAVPERQQTLRATIDWSHSLLTNQEQRIFRRMAAFVGGCTLEDVEAVCAEADESAIDSVESLVDKALVQVDGQTDRLRMLQTIGEYAAERLGDAGETGVIATRHARRYAQLAVHIRDGIEGSYEIAALQRGIADEGNLIAALDTFLAAGGRGDSSALEAGMKMCGDLYFYWHIRGKNVTALEYASAFLEADTSRSQTAGRAGALITAGLGSWVLGEFQKAADQWNESYEIATACDARPERCKAAFFQALALVGIDIEAARRWTNEGIELARRDDFVWALGLASAFDGIVRAVSGDLGGAHARYSEALAIQERLGDYEGAGVSLGGMAALAAGREDFASALDLYLQSLTAFETCGDRAEEARVLSEMAWTYLRNGDAPTARRYFFDSVQAYTDVGSVRGVGLSMVGLASTEVAERPYRAVQIAAAAEVYAGQEGIVNVYSDETPGREFVDKARAVLTVEDVTRATELGRRLSITQAIDLARSA